VRVFAVEDTTAQVCWASLPPGRSTFDAGGRKVVVDVGPGGRPGGTVITDLEPATRYTLRVDGRPVCRFDTLAPPPGKLLSRFATITDIHLGTRSFGAVIRRPEVVPPGVEPHPLRCTRAAIAEAMAWGAEALVVKGDVTARGRPAEVDTAIELLCSLPIPVEVVPGNHDLKRGAIGGPSSSCWPARRRPASSPPTTTPSGSRRATCIRRASPPATPGRCSTPSWPPTRPR
jgi:hypothetical protein